MRLDRADEIGEFRRHFGANSFDHNLKSSALKFILMPFWR